MKLILRFAILTIVSLFSLYTTVKSQQVARMTPGGRGYLEYLPPGYSTNTDLYPTIIFLHGSGERGNGSPTDLNKVTAQGTPKFIKNGHNMCFTVSGVTECFIVLSPQQTTNRWGWEGDVMPFIQYAKANYRIDPNRIYVTGLSMGGAGSWVTSYDATNEPNTIAAIAPVSANGDYNLAKITAQRKIAVWAFHGDADTAIPINDGRRPINGMNSVNPNPVPIFTTIVGGGHNGATWDKAYSPTNNFYTPNVYQWFLAQRIGPPTPQPPTVNAGTNKTITLPTNSVSQTGTATDSDGTIVSTVWAQVSGPTTATIGSPNLLTTLFSNLMAGSYVFRLTATDNSGLSSSAQVTIQVNPEPPKIPPTANAGPDRTITEPDNSIVLTGTTSDTDGTIVSRLWQQVSGPNTATLSGQTTLSVSISNLIVGSYTFSLTATDNDGLTGSDVAVVSVLAAPPNAPPNANAGADQTITLPQNSVSLSGSGTDTDGTIVSYAWSQVSGPGTATFTPTNQAATVVSNLAQGVYTLLLTVTDDKGAQGTDLVLITVLPVPPNNPPTANAGTDISITLPQNSTTLNGSGTDTDGTITSYQWVQTSGPNIANMVSPSSASTAINTLVEGNYLFTLTVTDDDGSQASDQVLVSVLPEPPNQPPIANAGVDRTLTLPVNSLTLTGGGTDADGTVTLYQWSQINGPNAATIATPAAASTLISSLIQGVYSFQLTVTDDKGATGSDIVQVTVFPPANQSPTVDAGSNQSITLPINTVSLTGTSNDPDGTITEHLWEQVSGPSTATIQTPSNVATQVSGLAAGIYVFRLTVTDNNGAKASDQVSVTVQPQPPNIPPTANAGADITLTLPNNSATINGSGTDADGSIVSYEWSFVSGPGAGSTSDLDQPSLTLSDLVEGVYVFRLTVTDDRGATATDEVKIFVNAVNIPPVANAGLDKAITLPTNTVVITGSATDADGTLESSVWEQVSGPNAAIINNPFEFEITVSGLIEGIYVFNLRVTDNEGTTDSDQMQVVVNPEPPNIPPVANTGANQEITLPINAVTFNGSGTDPDGTVVSFLWSQVSGPNTATSTNVNQQSITFSNLIAGLYTFRLTVTDNRGAAGQRDVTVKVNPQPINIPPAANAGTDITITLPINTTTLNGSGNDPDGTIVSHAWTQISGPSIASFSAPSNASTGLSNLVEGIYVFRLTVTDNDNLNGFDEVLVTVRPVPYNLPPIASAGNNLIITLPTNTATLTGSGQDQDGTIAIYTWSQVSGPSIATTSPVTQPTINLSDLIEGVYLFRLTVTDDKGSTGFDEVRVRVQPIPANQPPIANAGTNKVITLPANSTTLEGSGTDADGTIASYLWEQRSGPSSATVSALNAQNLSVSALIEGTYIFRITVTDNLGAFGFDEVNIRVNPPLPNSPPVVSTDGDKTITLPLNSVVVQGSASDADGTISTILWTQQSGPSAAQLNGASTLTLSAQNLLQGIYVFRITVTDNNNLSSFAEVRATVNPQPLNLPPTVSAGADQQIIIPPASVNLSGTASDSDGTIASVLWAQVSGPSSTTLTNSNSLNSTASQLVPGVYTFRLTATDNSGASNTDDVSITVIANIPPTAFAGDDVEIDFPENTVQLTGGGLDVDGMITSYAWTQISGPNNSMITSPTTASTSVQGLVVGTYEFQLQVTDNNGQTGTDIVVVEVRAVAGNIAPTVFAGEDILITLPRSNADLTGQASDEDGEIISYLWTQLSGPSAAIITQPNSINTTIENLIEGVYAFELTVGDNGGLSASDVVQVTVTELDLKEVTFPKIFSPNGDGTNDYWTWESPERFEGCKLSIFTSGGHKVFEKTSYDNTWDGSFSGKPLNEGGYYFTLKCSGGKQTSGGVRIIR